MPNQQIYQLSDETPVAPALADVFPYQVADGSEEAQIGTFTQLKSTLLLNNVDNTSDVNKPVSTAQATALATKQATLVPGTNAPKIWIVYATQSSTDAPTIGTTVKNDFSGTITFAYSGVGVYNINNTSAEFTAGKTTVKFANGLNQAGSMGAANQSTTQISIGSRNSSGTSANDLMASTLIEITVYP